MQATWTLIKLSWKSQMIYRLDLFSQLALMFWSYGLQYVFFSEVFHYTNDLAGWTEVQTFAVFSILIFITLSVETIGRSILEFFRVLHRGNIEPFLLKPISISKLLWLRWCRPVNVIPLFLWTAASVHHRLFNDVSELVGGYPGLLALAFLICLAILANICFMTLVSLMTFVIQRELPVDYIHEQVFRLAILPVTVYSRLGSYMMSVILPIAVSGAVPLIVVTRSDYLLGLAFSLGCIGTVILTWVSIRYGLSKFEGTGG